MPRHVFIKQRRRSQLPKGNLAVSCPLHAKLATVSMLVPVTSQGVALPSPESLALFQNLFKSLPTTVECGLRYIVYVGYEESDPFYGSFRGHAQMVDWFYDNVQRPLKDSRMSVQLRAVVVSGDKRATIIHELARKAHAEKADFLHVVDESSHLDNFKATQAIDTVCKQLQMAGALNQESPVPGFFHQSRMNVLESVYSRGEERTLS